MRMIRYIKNPKTYINKINEKNKFSIDNITVEHRSNNPKRDFLFVNRKQCKHIPCSPKEMIDMCDELAQQVHIILDNDEKVLIVGFAETATAIGNCVADALPQCKYVMVTTRENIEGSKQLITFEEEHSHATTQKLLTYDDEFEVKLNEYTYILFVEDEISTGNTILNFINAFEKVHSGFKYGVASICNWQNKKNIDRFKKAKVDRFALITGELVKEDIKMFRYTENFISNDSYTGLKPLECLDNKKVSFILSSAYPGIYIDTFKKERLGHLPKRDLSELYKKVDDIINEKIPESVRIIGTEEFMYIPIKVGEYLENRGISVICHATTRSTIDIIGTESSGLDSAIKHRYDTVSVYDESRINQIYNLNERTDLTIIVTDIKLTKTAAIRYYDLLSKYTDNVEIIIV